MVIINTICFLVIINKSKVEANFDLTNPDSIINKTKIDSIELVIKRKDSTIINIKEYIKNEIKEANNLNDSSSIELFKQLVSE